MVWLIYIYLYLFSVSILIGQEFTGGVRFLTYYDDKPITSLFLPKEPFLQFKDGLEIGFEICIREKSPFGYIVSTLHEDSDDGIILSYIEFRNPDTSFIELTIHNQPEVILTVPFPNSMIGRGQWHKINILYKENILSLTLNESGTVSAKVDLSHLKPFRLSFGNITNRLEPPRMDIRQVKVKHGTKMIHDYPLNEIEGEIIVDKVGFKNGLLKNGSLLAGHHKNIQHVQSIIIHPDRYGQMYVDQQDGHLTIINHNEFIKMDIQTWDILSKTETDTIPKNHKILYYDFQNQLYIYHHGGDLPFYQYDYTNGQWNGFDLSQKSKGQYFDGQRIYIPETNNIYSFGGYGWYTYKNDIFKYALNNKEWSMVTPKLRKGAIFYPQGPTNVVFDEPQNRIIIFGGTGSKTGKQESGITYFSDIWSFNVQTDSLVQLASHQPIPMNQSVLGVEVDWESNTAYKLMVVERDSFRTALLKEFDFPSGNAIEIPLKFGSYFKTIQHSEIFFDLVENTSELLIVVIGELYGKPNMNGIHIFTLALPLMKNEIRVKSNNHSIVYILMAVGLIGSGYWGRKRSLTSFKTRKMSMTDLPYEILEKGVTIQLFGVFRMWIDGKEVFKKDWQSKKARDLFIYLILKNHHGVTGEEISLTFWQNVASDSAVNSRGVALSKIRKVLGDYAHCLKRNENRFSIQYSSIFISDLHFVQSWMKSQKVQEYKKALSLFGNDGLLSEFHEDWAEAIKVDVNDSFIRYLKKMCRYESPQVELEMIEKIGAFLIHWNPLDDEALITYVKALKESDKQGLAHQVYNDFVVQYEKEMKEPYQLQYKNI